MLDWTLPELRSKEIYFFFYQIPNPQELLFFFFYHTPSVSTPLRQGAQGTSEPPALEEASLLLQILHDANNQVKTLKCQMILT